MTTTSARPSARAALDTAAAEHGWTHQDRYASQTVYTRGTDILTVTYTAAGVVHFWEHRTTTELNSVGGPSVVGDAFRTPTGKRAAVLALLIAAITPAPVVEVVPDGTPGALTLDDVKALAAGATEVTDEWLAQRKAALDAAPHGCTLIVDTHDDLGDIECGEPATHRIVFLTSDQADGYACDVHVGEADDPSLYATHPIGDDPHQLAADAPLGEITFHDGYADAPQCPCGNDVQGYGFTAAIVTTADGDPARRMVTADDEYGSAWRKTGEHIACLRPGCGRTYSAVGLDALDAPARPVAVAFRAKEVAEPARQH